MIDHFKSVNAVQLMLGKLKSPINKQWEYPTYLECQFGIRLIVLELLSKLEFGEQ